MNSIISINSAFKTIVNNIMVFFLFGIIFFGLSTPVLAADTTSGTPGITAGAGAGTTTTPATTTNSDNGGLLNFKACNFDEKSASAGSSGIAKCLQQVTTFLFIIGIFAAAFRFVMVALGNYIPNTSGNPEKEAREIITGLVWGLILIGIPGVILAIFNNSANNINFLFQSSGSNTTSPSNATNKDTNNNGTNNSPNTTNNNLNNTNSNLNPNNNGNTTNNPANPNNTNNTNNNPLNIDNNQTNNANTTQNNNNNSSPWPSIGFVVLDEPSLANEPTTLDGIKNCQTIYFRVKPDDGSSNKTIKMNNICENTDAYGGSSFNSINYGDILRVIDDGNGRKFQVIPGTRFTVGKYSSNNGIFTEVQALVPPKV